MVARASGPFLIALASILWATDALFRVPAVQELDPKLIVLIEHAIATLALLPVALAVERGRLFKLGRADWIRVLIVGAGASAVATVLFTASFQYMNPTVSILLQKLQPVLVVLLAYAFLGERPRSRFYSWAAVALLAALWLSFPELSYRTIFSGLKLHSTGVLFSLAAAALWAVATVLGKSLVSHAGVVKVTFLRFLAGMVALLVLVMVSGTHVPWGVVHEHSMTRALVYMSLVPGLTSMYLYYVGLKRTSASIATFVELLFPVTAVLLNTYLLGLTLQPVQLFAGAILLLAVANVSRA